jgi:hypothetical protein
MGSSRILVVACGLLSGLLTYAQPQWSALLAPVERDGYYTIVLSPEVVGRSREDLSDLRLLDASGKEVAYLMEREPAMYESSWIRSYRLLRNERVKRTTIIEMEADSLATVDELLVRVRNARVSKRARITGSDDRSDWYMIQDECLAVGEGDGATSVLRFVDLPLSDYRYYRIVLDDSLSAPVQVLDLGHSARARSEGRYIPIDGLSFTRTEDRSTTRIALHGGSPFSADRIVFDIRSDVPFQRQARFARHVSYTVRENKRDVTRTSEEQLSDFTLTRTSRGRVQAPGASVDTLFMLIYNGSDRPLDITGLRAFRLEERMIAKLKAGAHYTITTADAKANTARYDIAHFRDSLPPSIGVLNIPAMTARPVEQATGPSIAPSMKWVWAAIIGIGAIIAFSAVRLLRRSSTTSERSE